MIKIGVTEIKENYVKENLFLAPELKNVGANSLVDHPFISTVLQMDKY